MNPKRPYSTTVLVALAVLSFHTSTNVLAKPSSRPSIPKSTNARSIYNEGDDHHDTGTSSSSSTTSSITSSNNQRKTLPPWNPSPNIDKNGFLTSKYKRIYGSWEFQEDGHMDMHDDDADGEHERNQNKLNKKNRNLMHVFGGRFQKLEEPVYIRQVPGDGNCLFHSIAVSLTLLSNRTHVDMNSLPSTSSTDSSSKNDAYIRGTKTKRQPYKEYVHDLKHLHHYSRYLRLAAVSKLAQNPRKLLFLQGNEYLRARDLVSAAAAQYGMTADEYCELMKEESYWGGGPEICALCNFLKRPIHVYELCNDWDEEDDKDSDDNGVDNKNVNDNGDENDDRYGDDARLKCNANFRLRRMACFGSPKFDRNEALHILSADSRFPDITPGKQLLSGNHFLAIFPESIVDSVNGNMNVKNGIEARKRHQKRANVRGGDVSEHEFEADGKVKGRRRKTYLNHLTFFEEEDYIWNRGLLKYTRIDFIWRFFQRLKVAFS
jgi:hypothetical protein